MTKHIKNSLSIVLLSITLFYFSACKKKPVVDVTKPVITVVEPAMNDTLSLSVEPEVHVEFTTTDETALKSLTVVLTQNNTTTLLNESPSVDGLTVYSFHEHAVPTGIATTAPFKAVLTATDQAGNVETKTISFFVEP